MRTVLIAFVMLLAAGCTDDGMFSSCPFDNTITTVCADDGQGAQLTCVVEQHPQCPEDVCLSWKGSDPFCTRTCTVGGGECPSGSSCAPYAAAGGETLHFCVEDGNLAR